MKLSLPVIALVLALCTSSHAQPLLDLTATLGVAASVTANTEATITYGVAPAATTLVITADADSDVTLTAVSTVSADLPQGHSSLAVSAGAGYTLAVSGGSAVSAKLTTPPLSVAAQALVTSDGQVGCFRYDAAAQSYTQVDIESYNADKSITLDLPVAGTYFFVTLAVGLPVPTLYAEARATTAGESKAYAYPGGFLIKAKTTTDNTITTTRKNASDAVAPSGKMAAGVFFDITLQTEETVEAQLNYTYDAAAMAAAGIAETSLKLMFKSEAGVWTEPDSVMVDVQAKVVVATSTHFSEWGLFGSSILGLGVSVKANTATSIEFADGTMLSVTTDANAQVTLKAVVTATITGSAALPSGSTALSFGAHGGLELMVEGGNMVSASVTTSPLSASARALITGSVSAGCLMFDAEAESYTQVDIESYSADTGSITVELPMEGTYVFAALDGSVAVAVPVFVKLGEARATVAGETRSFAYQSGLQIGLKTQTDNAITVTRTESDASNPPAGKIGLGFVLDIELDKEETIEGTLEVAYDASAVAAKGIAESSLKLMFQREAGGAWEEPDSVSVDVTAKVIVATTSHFSKWTAFGDAQGGTGGSGSGDGEGDGDGSGSGVGAGVDVGVGGGEGSDDDDDSGSAALRPTGVLFAFLATLSTLFLPRSF